MRFRKTLGFLILATALTFALSAWARQKSVGPSSAEPRPNAVRPYVACAAAALAPPGAQQKIVAPTLRSARADVAASLPRHGGIKPPLRYAALKDSATTPGASTAHSTANRPRATSNFVGEVGIEDGYERPD